MNQSSVVLLSLEQRAAVGQPAEVCINQQRYVPKETSVLPPWRCLKLQSGT